MTVHAEPMSVGRPLWDHHDGPFWRNRAACDLVVADVAAAEMTAAEAHLAAVVDDAWQLLGWDPAVWRAARTAETAERAWRRGTIAFAVEQRLAMSLPRPQDWLVVTNTT